MSLYPPFFILFIFVSYFGFLCLYFESDFKSDFESNFESDFESDFGSDNLVSLSYSEAAFSANLFGLFYA